MVDVGGLLSGVSSAINTGAQHTIATKNLGLQKDMFRYNKRLQERIFEREDNAVQRRATDMMAAGLSKTLAAGGGANAGAAITTPAPQFEAPDYSAPAKDMLGAMQQTANIAQTKAQEKLLSMQAQKTAEETKLTKIVQGMRNIDLKNSQDTGIGSASTFLGQAFKDLTGAMKNSNIAKWLVKEKREKMKDNIKNIPAKTKLKSFILNGFGIR